MAKESLQRKRCTQELGGWLGGRILTPPYDKSVAKRYELGMLEGISLGYALRPPAALLRRAGLPTISARLP